MNRFVRRWLMVLVLVATLASVGPASGVTVPGTADIFLAGQPDGTQFLFGSFDSAPAQSPVDLGMTVFTGEMLQFSVTGATGNDSGIPATASSTPDGGSAFAPDPATFGPILGLSSITVDFNALIAVFLADGPPDSNATPAALSFASAAETSFASLAPQLQQVFFIGDGLTGEGSGQRQTFIVPAGATRLFLGSADGTGQNSNNFGSFDVQVTGVPEPPSLVLVGWAGAVWIGLTWSRRRRKG